MKYFILVALVVPISFLAHAQASPKPLFIRAKCDLSSTVLSAKSMILRDRQAGGGAANQIRIFL